MKTKAFFTIILLSYCFYGFSQSEVRAWYADGQVFVIWELDGTPPETFGIYASPTPFTHTNDALLVGRPFSWEYIGYALKENLDDLSATYIIPNGQDSLYQLTLNEGLFVFTPHQSGSLFFAVTQWGDTEVILGQNITDAVVEFTFDPVNDPIECHLQRTFPSPFSTDHICFAFQMWADGRQNHWEGRPDFPIMANAAKNGMPSLFLVSVPLDLDTTMAYPLSIWLHGGGNDGKARQSLAGRREEVNIDPVEGILVAHNDRLHGYRGTSAPTPDQASWHFGWSKNYNPFNSIQLTMDTVINYTQRRYLWIDEWLIKKFNIDTHRINIHGHSMGAAGATAMVKCYPEHYASGTVFNTSCKGPQTSPGAAFYLGSFTSNFPTNLQNRNSEPVHVFDVWDMYTNCSSQRDLPIIRNWHGKRDDNDVNHWGPVAVENFIICDSTGTGLQGYWSEREHGLASANDHWIMGKPAHMQTVSDNVDFAEYHYRSDVSYPAFFNHRLDNKNNHPGTGLIGINNGDGNNWGTWGGYHRWGPISETQQSWQTIAWLESNALFLNDNSPEDFLTADLAIRRPQTFQPITGEVISWSVKDFASGVILQSGTTIVQEDKLVVVPQIEIYKENIRKVLITIKHGTTSNEEIYRESSILQISPNPTHGFIYTEADWNMVTIIDVSGKEIKQLRASSSSQILDVSYLTSGLYYLIIMTNNRKRKLGKLVKL